MHRFAFAACLGLFIIWSTGCTPGQPKAPPLVAVKGTVKLDGNAMPSGEIEFDFAGQPAKVLPIKDGAYAGEAHVGKNVVRIHLYKEAASTTEPKATTKVDQIPAKYNAQTTLSADVAAGGGEFNFDAASK